LSEGGLLKHLAFLHLSVDQQDAIAQAEDGHLDREFNAMRSWAIDGWSSHFPSRPLDTKELIHHLLGKPLADFPPSSLKSLCPSTASSLWI